jgi:hypothetical protein
MQLLRHLQRHAAAKGEAAQVIGWLRLYAPYRLDVGGRNLFDAVERLALPVCAHRAEPVKRLAGWEVPRQVEQAKGLAADRVDAEERRVVAARLEPHQRRPVVETRLLLERLGELRHGRHLKQDVGGKFYSAHFLDCCQDLDCCYGFPAQFGEVIVCANIVPL